MHSQYSTELSLGKANTQQFNLLIKQNILQWPIFLQELLSKYYKSLTEFCNYCQMVKYCVSTVVVHCVQHWRHGLYAAIIVISVG